MHRPIFSRALHAVLAVALLVGCGLNSPDSSRPKNAETWYRRAGTEFKEADFEEAHDSAQKALAVVPLDPQVRTLAAEIALTSLDYAEVLRLLKGVRTTDAARLRGRALWYKGDLDAAADELETMLNDPEVKDDWAKAASKLARIGTGRAPFSHAGAMLASVEMVHVSAVAPYFVVPVEIDGESSLAMIATGSPEVVLDSATRPEPSWVSLRIGEKFEVHDVPAFARDLSGVSKELGVPIKALIGVNLLRHVNATFDFTGHQFVVRSFAPPPPPAATRVDLRYVRGGGVVVRAALGGEKGPRGAFWIDTLRSFSLALDADGWKKAGVEVDKLKPIEGDPEQKREGVVPVIRLGAFDVPRVHGLYGVSFSDTEKAMSVDLDGIIGAGLLFPYRCTFADGGRMLWVEDASSTQQLLGTPAGAQPDARGLPLPQPAGVGTSPLAPTNAPPAPKP